MQLIFGNLNSVIILQTLFIGFGIIYFTRTVATHFNLDTIIKSLVALFLFLPMLQFFNSLITEPISYALSLLFVSFVIKLIYPTVQIVNNLSSSVAFASLVTVLWPFMSTGSLLKNHHGIQVFFVISLCFILTKHKNEL